MVCMPRLESKSKKVQKGDSHQNRVGPSWRKYPWPDYPSPSDAVLAALVCECEEVPVAERMKICRNPRDEKFLEVTAAERASPGVSGDADFLDLHPFRTVRIVTPADFLRGSDPQ